MFVLVNKIKYDLEPRNNIGFTVCVLCSNNLISGKYFNLFKLLVLITSHAHEFDLKGNVVFEIICKALGLRETWYFGLMYKCKKHKILKWLKMKKKLSDLNLIKYSDNKYDKNAIIDKILPEAVSSELIQTYSTFILLASWTTNY